MRRALFVPLLLAACAAPEVVAPPPLGAVEVTRTELADQTFEGFAAIAHLSLPEGFTPTSVSWEVEIRDVVVGKGSSTPEVEGSKAKVRAASRYGPDDKFAELLEEGATLEFVLRGALSDGAREAPFSVAYQVRGPHIPKITIFHIESSSHYDSKEINLVFFPRIENPNPFDVKIEQITYKLSINGVELVGDGVTARNETVPGSSASQVEISVLLSENNFKEVGKFLKTATGLTYRIEASIDLPIGQIPFEAAGPIVMGKPAPAGFDENKPGSSEE